MAVIYYRFRSQRPEQISTVAFDGTGLTVFEFKREVITLNKLFNTNDVDVGVFSAEEQDKEFDDDNEVIPRSSTVIVRRTAALKKGRGNIARYLAGRPRVVKSAVNALTTTAATTQGITTGQPESEQDAIQKMFADQEDQWSQQQSVMATAARIDTPRTNAKLDESIPDYYICYKCGEKGKHHIRNCPKNNDPNWEGVRIKKTTGIPKSYLKTVEVDPTMDGSEEGKNYMINEEGKYVVQVADTKSWQQFQAAASSKGNSNQNGKLDPLWETPVPVSDETPDEIKNLRDDSDEKGRVWRTPMLMPCCKKRYSKQFIEDKLIDNDFTCPNCGQEEIYLDSLESDDDMKKKVDDYIEERRKNPSLLVVNSKSATQDVVPKEGENANGETTNDTGDEPVAKRQQLNPAGMMPMPMMMPGMMPMPFMPFMPGMMPGMMPQNMMNQQQQQQQQQHPQQQQK